MQRPPTRSYPAAAELEEFSAPVHEAYRSAAGRVEPHLTIGSRRSWVAAGLDLARGGPQYWDAAVEYFRASPDMVAALTTRRFLRWARLGRTLAGESGAVAAAFYQASPAAIVYLDPARIGMWADLGLRLCRSADAADTVARRFFDASPGLLQCGSTDALALLSGVLLQTNRYSPHLSMEVLNLANRLCAAVPGPDLTAFLTGGERMARANMAALRPYFEAGLTLYARLNPSDRGRYLHLMTQVTQATPRGLSSYLTDAYLYLGPLLEAHGLAPLEMSVRIAEHSTAAAREFIRNAAAVAGRLTIGQMDAWCRHGEALLANHEESGIGFFQLQSREAHDTLTALTPAVELAEVREVLRLYCQALMGKMVSIVAEERLDDRNTHWASGKEIDWEGATIFCPTYMRDFPTKDGNFEAYKVLATHQAGHLEFGTFAFTFAGDGRLLPPLRQTLIRLQGKERPYYTEFEQYFNLFIDRRLAQDVFTIAEDTRVDQQVRREYRGIRPAFRRVQANASGARPDYRRLRLREQCVEMLLRMSLEAEPVYAVPEALADRISEAAGLVNLLASGQATVEDAAEAAIRLYVVLSLVPNVDPNEYHHQPWVTLDLSQAQYDPRAEDSDQIIRAFLEVNQQPDQPSADEYTPMQPVNHRGDLRPEQYQALQKAQRQTRQLAQWQSQQGDSEGITGLDALSDEELLSLLQDYLLIGESFDDPDGEWGSAETGITREYLLNFLRTMRDPGRMNQREVPHIGEDEVQTAVYDEWDYRARAYRPKWCQVRQRVIKEGGREFYDQTLAEYRWLVQGVRKQFEMLRPESLGKVKRLHDGEEFDLDAVVDVHVQRRSGHAPDDKVYWRRNKTDRSVAVALLVDLSVSTGEAIEHDADRLAREADSEEERRMAQKRIIDLERESVVLFIEALEQIGDSYGIYGFSGSGRNNVQFYTIKDMQELFTDRVRRRVDKMTALQGTRMGPAIRHTIAKLERIEAKTKVLIMLSDGRPQDREYGTLPWDPDALPRSFQSFNDFGLGSLAHEALMLDEKEYAVHDTKQALNEARQKGVTPFCLSVDKQGRDYLRAMCGDIGYEVVSEIQSLPRRLPALYKRLTT